MKLADVVAPLASEEFVSSYLGQTWTLQHGDSRRFEPLLSWTELNRLLACTRIAADSRRIQLVQNGARIPPEKYLYPNRYGAVLNSGAVERLLRNGATLVFDAINELVPAIDELARDCEAAVGGRVQVNLYAGWRTQRGFDLHWDDHDTLILQVYGKKEWKVYEPTLKYPTKSAPGHVSPTCPPIWHGCLESGSALYMPRGWWHVAAPLDGPSLHLTIGLSQLDGDYLMRWLTAQLHQHEVYRMDIPFRAEAAVQAAYLAAVREAIIASLADDALAQVLGYCDADMPRPTPPRLPKVGDSSPASLTPESQVSLATRITSRTLPDGRTTLEFDGAEVSCTPVLGAAVLRMNDRADHKWGTMTATLTPPLVSEMKSLLTVMHLAGAVRIS